jgi:hypothetical protein
MITINLHWWYIPIAFIIFPFVYEFIIRKQEPGGLFPDAHIDTMFVGVICTIIAMTICITKWLS